MAEPSTTLRRAAPLAGGAGIAGMAAVLIRVDPASPGSPFPACRFRAVTGLWCPGCGLTRGAHQLLTGDLAGALGSNLFVPVAIVATAVGWWWWLRSAWGHPLGARPRRAAERVGAGVVAAAIAYGVLRNIPVDPFSALAP